MYKLFLFLPLSFLIITSCTDSRATNHSVFMIAQTPPDSIRIDANYIDSSGLTIQDRFMVPDGYKRIYLDDEFASYLRRLPLHSIEHKVNYYDGSEKPSEGVYCSVVDLPIGTRDRHQCADAVMNVRAHYLFDAEKYDQIHFNFTNGFKAEYAKWRQGKRISVRGNNVSYYSTSKESESYGSFLDYLQTVYAYAGTYSLSKELESVRINELRPGDVFIKGGFPGHAVLVIDVVVDDNGGKKFMLAQSYMPAQELQVLINPLDKNGSPWYDLSEARGQLFTPEWTFTTDQLKRFKND